MNANSSDRSSQLATQPAAPAEVVADLNSPAYDAYFGQVRKYQDSLPRYILWDSKHPDYPVEWSCPGRPPRDGEIGFFRHDMVNELLTEQRAATQPAESKACASVGVEPAPIEGFTDSERLAFLHTTNEDRQGYEWGVARVKYDDAGKLAECLWGASDSTDLDAAMRFAARKEGRATPPAQAPAAPSVGEPIEDVALIQSVLNGYPKSMAREDAMRSLRRISAKLVTTPNVMKAAAEAFGYDGGLQTINESDLTRFAELLAIPPAAPAATEAPSTPTQAPSTGAVDVTDKLIAECMASISDPLQWGTFPKDLRDAVREFSHLLVVRLTSSAQAATHGAEAKTWAAYIAAMIETYLNFDNPKEGREAAIAGIIERRMWSAPPVVQPAPRYGFKCYSCQHEWEANTPDSDCPKGHCGTTNRFNVDHQPASPAVEVASARLQWLHSPASNNVDGWEWGIFRVKWGQSEGYHQIRHTFSNFSDLDAAMAASGATPTPAVAVPGSLTDEQIDTAWAITNSEGGAGLGWRRFARRVLALATTSTAAQPDIERAAKVLAECMDYPWQHMPEQGRATMRKHVESILAASQPPGAATPKGGEA